MGKLKDLFSNKWTTVGCLNLDCDNTWPWSNDKKFCTDCGHDLSPLPHCDCGELINLKQLTLKVRKKITQYCGGCGALVTEEYLAKYISKAFKVIVKAVSEDLAVTNGKPAVSRSQR